jgi:hypothetical protein
MHALEGGNSSFHLSPALSPRRAEEKGTGQSRDSVLSYPLPREEGKETRIEGCSAIKKSGSSEEVALV